MAEAPIDSTTNSPAVTDQTAGDDLYFDLPSGKGLSFASADSITRRSFAHVILFAGTAKSGKTTLLSTLHLLFQKQPFSGHLFSGSATLVGFEERNFYVEVDSGLAEPTTERTIISEVLHLQVRSTDLAKEPSDVLLCDISGEDFREAKDSMEVCQRMSILLRADTFVLLIDGKKLIDPASRQRAKNDPLTLLRNCLDGQMLRPETAVDILFTKWDLVKASPDKDEIEAFSQTVEAAIQRQFSSRLKHLRIARIAAHPFEGDLPLGYGLEKPFQLWVEHRAHRTVEKTPTPEGSTEYDRFLFRKLPESIGHGG